jgi:hypothetical protein
MARRTEMASGDGRRCRARPSHSVGSCRDARARYREQVTKSEDPGACRAAQAARARARCHGEHG